MLCRGPTPRSACTHRRGVCLHGALLFALRLFTTKRYDHKTPARAGRPALCLAVPFRRVPPSMVAAPARTASIPFPALPVKLPHLCCNTHCVDVCLGGLVSVHWLARPPLECGPVGTWSELRTLFRRGLPSIRGARVAAHRGSSVDGFSEIKSFCGKSSTAPGLQTRPARAASRDSTPDSKPPRTEGKHEEWRRTGAPDAAGARRLEGQHAGL